MRSDFLLPLCVEPEVAVEARILAVRPLWPWLEVRLLSSAARRARGAAAVVGFTSWLSGIARGLGVIVVVVVGGDPEVEAGLWFEVMSRVRFLCSSMLVLMRY